jgi:hypothetical protein
MLPVNGSVPHVGTVGNRNADVHHRQHKNRQASVGTSQTHSLGITCPAS